MKIEFGSVEEFHEEGFYDIIKGIVDKEHKKGDIFSLDTRTRIEKRIKEVEATLEKYSKKYIDRDKPPERFYTCKTTVIGDAYNIFVGVEFTHFYVKRPEGDAILKTKKVFWFNNE